MASEVTCECCGTKSADESQPTEAAMTCYCPVEGDIDTLSKKYSMQIVSIVGSHGPVRYGAIEEALGNPSTSTFSDNLSELVEAGLLDRKSYDEIPPRVEYSLTERGRELEERIEPLLAWAAEN